MSRRRCLLIKSIKRNKSYSSISKGDEFIIECRVNLTEALNVTQLEVSILLIALSYAYAKFDKFAFVLNLFKFKIYQLYYQKCKILLYL